MCFKQIKLLTLTSLVWLSLAISPTNAKTLVYCIEAAPKSFSPPYISFESDIAMQVFDRLVEFEPDSTKIRPGLAKSWEISPDGLTYTFKLRKGVKFHSTKDFRSTRDFNADDVVFTFERQLKEDHPYHKVSGGVYVLFESLGLNKILKDVKKIDDYTVQFKLNQPESPLLADLAIAGFSSIMSAEFANQMMKADTPEKFDLIPVGTGPFTFMNYQKDVAVRFKANIGYWRGKPKIDNLVFSIITDPGIRTAKLEKGECHIMPSPNLSDVDKMSKNPDLTLLGQEGLNANFLTLNTKKKPLNDVRVRRALAMAINKDAIVNGIFQGHGSKATSPFPSASWGYNKDIKDYPHDPKQAKKLLVEAGYPDGFEIDLWAMPAPRPYNPNGKRMAELIQADWAKIGVTAKIVTYEWGEYIKRALEGEHEVFMGGWQSGNGDPDYFLDALFSCHAIGGYNYAFWCNEDYDNLVLTAKKTTDTSKRSKLYEQALALLHKELPVIPLTHSRSIIPVRKEVKGFIQHPLATINNLYEVDIEENK